MRFAVYRKRLVEGHFRFRRDEHAKNRGRYLQLAELGQAPTAMVIACCDARVDVSAIFDAEPGSLFIMRNVANLVPPYEPEGKYHGTSAAVEYAATALKVPHIIVLGHSHCGGVDTYRRGVRDKVPEHGFIGRWLTLLDGLEAGRERHLRLWRRDGVRIRGRALIDRQSRHVSLHPEAVKEGLLALARAAFRSRQRENCSASSRRAGASRRSASLETRKRQAARSSRLRLMIVSAICTVLSAAPLRRLSDTTQKDSPLSSVWSSRMRLTKVA